MVGKVWHNFFSLFVNPFPVIFASETEPLFLLHVISYSTLQMQNPFLIRTFTSKSQQLTYQRNIPCCIQHTAYYLCYNILKSLRYKTHVFHTRSYSVLNSDDTCRTAVQVFIPQQPRKWMQTWIFSLRSWSSNISLGNLVLAANRNKGQYHLAAPLYPRCLHWACRRDPRSRTGCSGGSINSHLDAFENRHVKLPPAFKQRSEHLGWPQAGLAHTKLCSAGRSLADQ